MRPEPRLISRLFFPRSEISVWLFADPISERTINGKLNPIPKKRKLRTFEAKPIIVSALVNKAAMKSGLQGITIAPKKNPKRNALRKGFLEVGALICGNNVTTSIFRIKSMLKAPRRINAIGEIIPITFVRDDSRKVVKIKPIRDMKEITPALITSPRKRGNFLSFGLSVNFPVR